MIVDLTFCLWDDDYNLVDFINENSTLTLLLKIFERFFYPKCQVLTVSKDTSIV